MLDEVTFSVPEQKPTKRTVSIVHTGVHRQSAMLLCLLNFLSTHFQSTERLLFLRPVDDTRYYCQTTPSHQQLRYFLTLFYWQLFAYFSDSSYTLARSFLLHYPDTKRDKRCVLSQHTTDARSRQTFHFGYVPSHSFAEQTKLRPIYQDE